MSKSWSGTQAGGRKHIAIGIGAAQKIAPVIPLVKGVSHGESRVGISRLRDDHRVA